MTLTTLLLDAGGTLVYPNFGRIAEEFARDGHPVKATALLEAEAQLRYELDQPEVVTITDDNERWVRYMRGLAHAAGLSRSPEEAIRRLKEYHDTHNLWEHVPPDIPLALEALKRRFRLGVVSNANGTVRSKFTRLGLAHHFEIIVDSQEEGVEKPDPRIFQIALERMRLDASEAGYVGDFYHIDVAGARAAGLSPFLLDPFGLHRDKPCRRIASLADLVKLPV